MRLDQMWLNWIRAIGVAIASVALSTTAPAADGTTGEKYKPVFEVRLAANSGAIVAAYLRAYRSPTSEVAIKRWENFLGKYAEDDSIEDITGLTLLRQAHLELMRLYYQKGRVKEADRLLKKANDYLVYSVPEPAKAESWCKANNFCE
jgi:hypothetical protein